jgi:hypothetical protein
LQKKGRDFTVPENYCLLPDFSCLPLNSKKYKKLTRTVRRLQYRIPRADSGIKDCFACMLANGQNVKIDRG